MGKRRVNARRTEFIFQQASTTFPYRENLLRTGLARDGDNSIYYPDRSNRRSTKVNVEGRLRKVGTVLAVPQPVAASDWKSRASLTAKPTKATGEVPTQVAAVNGAVQVVEGINDANSSIRRVTTLDFNH
jgi:hypothetical protein